MSLPVRMSGEIALQMTLPDGRQAGAALRFGDEHVFGSAAQACEFVRNWANQVEAHAVRQETEVTA